jgi:hypothetical protein
MLVFAARAKASHLNVALWRILVLRPYSADGRLWRF